MSHGIDVPPNIVDMVTTLTVRPGDQVILFVPADTERQVVDGLRSELRLRHPGLTWTVIAGAVTAMRIPGEGQ